MMHKLMQGMCDLDWRISQALWPITKLWCKITGRDNTTLARLTLVIGFVMIEIGNALLYVKEPSILYALLSMFLLTVWAAMTARDWHDMGKFRKLQDDPSDVLNVDYEALVHFMYFRAIWRVPFTLILFAFAGAGLLAGYVSWFALGYVVQSLAMYFALHIHPGGKKITERLKDKAQAAAAKVKSLIPSPAPIPLPVGVS